MYENIHFPIEKYLLSLFIRIHLNPKTKITLKKAFTKKK